MGGSQTPPYAEGIVGSIEGRIRKRLSANPDDSTYKSLAARLEQLRQMHSSWRPPTLSNSSRSCSRSLRTSVAADCKGPAMSKRNAVGKDDLACLCRRSALAPLRSSSTRFMPEATPEIVEDVVHEIDAVQASSRHRSPPKRRLNWQTSREGTRLVKTGFASRLRKNSGCRRPVASLTALTTTSLSTTRLSDRANARGWRPFRLPRGSSRRLGSTTSHAPQTWKPHWKPAVANGGGKRAWL